MNGITLESATRRNHPRNGAPVLAVWVSDEDLIDQLDRMNVPALCAIPWSDELTNWIGKWRPMDLTTGKRAESQEAALSNPTVASAIESVTRMANLSNGLDSYNRRLMGNALLILLGANEAIDADELEAWAARHGWGARQAAEIRQMLDQLRQGRRLRFGPNPFNADALDHWKGEAS